MSNGIGPLAVIVVFYYMSTYCHHSLFGEHMHDNQGDPGCFSGGMDMNRGMHVSLGQRTKAKDSLSRRLDLTKRPKCLSFSRWL